MDGTQLRIRNTNTCPRRSVCLLPLSFFFSGPHVPVNMDIHCGCKSPRWDSHHVTIFGVFLLLLSAHACRRLTRQVWLQETDATSRPMIKSDLAHFGLCVHWTGFHIGHLPPAQLISGFLVLDMVTLSILIRVGIHFRYVFSFLSVNGPWPKAK